jgi:hypothetical protein
MFMFLLGASGFMFGVITTAMCAMIWSHKAKAAAARAYTERLARLQEYDLLPLQRAHYEQ